MIGLFKALCRRGMVWAGLVAALGLIPPAANLVMDKISAERTSPLEFRSIHDCIGRGGFATWNSTTDDFTCKKP
jgi:hypothetical protein